VTKHAIVTGGAGFIGSHLVDSLIADGFSVVVVDDLSTGNADRLPTEATLEVVDISREQVLDRVFDLVKPHAVFHLAAQAMVTVSVKDPQRDCEVNVRGTLNVVQAAGRHGAPVVFTSTGGALYGECDEPATERVPPEPISPYGASKWAGEAYVRTWARASGIPHTVCRLANVYGPRQTAHGEAGVVSIFSRLLWEGTAPTLYGHGEAVRDYVHVVDVVRALRSASGVPGIFNVATSVPSSVGEVFALLQKAAGTDLRPTLAPLRAGELERSLISYAHIERLLGWRPEVAFADGVRETYHELVRLFESNAAR
jgi:UDP-glucose 4-epimerase